MTLLAHGIGARGDLPLSVGTLAVVAGAALFVSFAALLAGWKEPRLAGIAKGRSVFTVSSGAALSGHDDNKNCWSACCWGLTLVCAFRSRQHSRKYCSADGLCAFLDCDSSEFSDIWRLVASF